MGSGKSTGKTISNGRNTLFPVEVPNKTNPMRYHGNFIRRVKYTGIVPPKTIKHSPYRFLKQWVSHWRKNSFSKSMGYNGTCVGIYSNWDMIGCNL